MGSKLTNQEILNQNQKIDDRLKALRDANNTLHQQQAANMRQQMWSGLKWGFKGFGNIAKSLSTPNTSNRMRIAQLPARRSDIDIIRKANTTMLKHPQLRNRDIRGRRIK